MNLVFLPQSRTLKPFLVVEKDGIHPGKIRESGFGR